MRRHLRRLWAGFRRLVLIVVLVILIVPWLVAAWGAVAPVPITSFMVIRTFEGYGTTKSWRGLDAISPHLGQAVVAAEDNFYCSHHGVDWQAVSDAWTEFRDGDRLRGASTLTMQATKNLMLWEGRNPVRKALEAYGATVLDLVWSKQRLLEIYLNIVEWAPGIYGAEAAAQHHFGVSADGLTRRQSALLAAILPNPLGWAANPPSDYVSRRASAIERGIEQLGPMLDCTA